MRRNTMKRILTKVLVGVVRLLVLLVLVGAPAIAIAWLHTEVERLGGELVKQDAKLQEQHRVQAEWRDAVISEYRTMQAQLMMLQGR
jgi:cell division protein FtsL